MKLALAAGVALAGLSLSALAEEMPRADANNDGWITRAEASAMADRAFGDMDANNDGKLDASDHRDDRMFEHRMHGRGHGAGEARNEDHDHHVIVRRESGVLEHQREADAAGPPRPPHPSMFMMIVANNEEADLNGDDALSLEEFRSQHLRFFDASDANGDGRIRFDPPERPEPPEAPRPPQPPR